MVSSILKEILLTVLDNNLSVGVILNTLKINLKKKNTIKKLKIDGY